MNTYTSLNWICNNYAGSNPNCFTLASTYYTGVRKLVRRELDEEVDEEVVAEVEEVEI